MPQPYCRQPTDNRSHPTIFSATHTHTHTRRHTHTHTHTHTHNRAGAQARTNERANAHAQSAPTHPRTSFRFGVEISGSSTVVGQVEKVNLSELQEMSLSCFLLRQQWRIKQQWFRNTRTLNHICMCAQSVFVGSRPRRAPCTRQTAHTHTRRDTHTHTHTDHLRQKVLQSKGNHLWFSSAKVFPKASFDIRPLPRHWCQKVHGE